MRNPDSADVHDDDELDALVHCLGRCIEELLQPLKDLEVRQTIFLICLVIYCRLGWYEADVLTALQPVPGNENHRHLRRRFCKWFQKIVAQELPDGRRVGRISDDGGPAAHALIDGLADGLGVTDGVAQFVVLGIFTDDNAQHRQAQASPPILADASFKWRRTLLAFDMLCQRRP